MHDSDHRAVFFEHAELQETSPAKAYNTGRYLTSLQGMSLSGFQGSRVDFIATWFEELRRLNELSSESLSYDMTKGLLLKAIQDDPKLPDVFPTLTPTRHREADIEAK